MKRAVSMEPGGCLVPSLKVNPSAVWYSWLFFGRLEKFMLSGVVTTSPPDAVLPSKTHFGCLKVSYLPLLTMVRHSAINLKSLPNCYTTLTALSFLKEVRSDIGDWTSKAAMLND